MYSKVSASNSFSWKVHGDDLDLQCNESVNSNFQELV